MHSKFWKDALNLIECRRLSIHLHASKLPIRPNDSLLRESAMPLEIQLLEHPTEEERSAILTPLLAHNLANGGDDECAGITGTPTASTRTG